jgi:hypothetical protein
MSDVPFPMTPSIPAEPALTQAQRVIYTFTAPSKTFNDIKRNTSWWMPFLLLAIAGYILFGAVTAKVGMQQVVDNQMHLDPKTEAKMASASPEQKAMTAKISLYVTEGVFIANPIFLLIGVAILSGGLLATINFGFGGKAKFWAVFSAYLYATLPSIIKTLLGTIVIFAGLDPESFNIKNFAPTNVAAIFLNPATANKALYSLASSLDLVTIWTLVLLSIGVATVAGVKRSSGYIAVFGWWAIFVLIGVGWAAAFS